MTNSVQPPSSTQLWWWKPNKTDSVYQFEYEWGQAASLIILYIYFSLHTQNIHPSVWEWLQSDRNRLETGCLSPWDLVSGSLNLIVLKANYLLSVTEWRPIFKKLCVTSSHGGWRFFLLELESAAVTEMYWFALKWLEGRFWTGLAHEQE